MTADKTGMPTHRVAILGGGMGGLTAAWRLANARTTNYEITIYQRDHLLGGKGASARNQDPGYGLRIEEHGIHILMGWYETAIGLLREVYEDLKDDAEDPTLGKVLAWDDVLLGHPSATMSETPELTGGDWDFWNVTLPKRRGKPGDGKATASATLLTVKAVMWLAYFRGHTNAILDAGIDLPEILKLPLFRFDTSISAQQWAERDEQLTEEAAEQHLAWFHSIDGAAQLDADIESLGHVFSTKMTAAGGAVGRIARRLFMGFWFAKAVATGLLREKVRERRDFERFDDVEFRCWLKKHGGLNRMDKLLTWDSPIVRILYDLAFGHECKFAAGVWAYAVLLFAFEYKGTFVYKMNGGMGDIVFAPLYLALKKRGVQFRFFHEVEDLHVDDRGFVSEVRIVDHGRLPNDYQPLIGVETPQREQKKVPCWPQRPNTPPSGNKRADIRHGEHFDSVVLAISVGGLPSICGNLAAANPRFSRMLATVRAGTVGTMAAQFWLNQDDSRLGAQKEDLVACYVRPFNSVVRMSHVLASECWRLDPDANPLECIYLCDQAPDNATAADVKGHLEEFLASDFQRLVPQFRHDHLVDPNGHSGARRVDAQYWRANVEGSDRYVITPPGSPAHRLAPGESGFRNLVLAGDWVETDINAGCLEAAARAGVGAAEAIMRNATDGPYYVDTPVDWVRPHPLLFQRAQMYILPRRGDPGRLAALCKQLITTPSGGRISATPLWDLVLITFANVPEGRSAPERNDGFLAEKECVFFVPIRMSVGKRDSYAALAPIAYVDNAIAVVAGREIYGFPKFQADKVTIQADPVHLAASALGLREFAATHQAEPRTVIAVRETGRGAPAIALPATLKEAAREATTETLAAMELDAASIFGARVPDWINALNLVFLKQFRDSTNPRRAAYQEITKTPATITNFRGGRLLRGKFDVELPALARPAVAAWLGLPERSEASLIVQMDFDFEFGLSTRLWP